MKFKKIVILEKTGIEEFATEDLESISNELITYSNSPSSNEEIIKRAQGADALLISWTSHIDSEVIHALPHLKYIGMCCSLYDEASANVNLSAAIQNSITVTGVRDYGDQGVVQYIFSTLIQLLLGVGKNKFIQEPIELESLNLGIIGLGSVGSKVAETANFFGMDVYYHNRTIREDVPYTYLALNDLLKKCDIISLHLPKNTRVIGHKEFNLLTGKKVLVNTGLGFSFDRDAFEKWIQNDDHYAIFDTDSVDDTFRDMHLSNDNIMMNTIVSGFTKNARKRLAEKVFTNMKKYLGE